MLIEISAVDLRQNLHQILNRVQHRRDSVVISKDGRPVAALIDAEFFARIRRMQDRFDALTSRLAAAHEAVPVEEGLADTDRTAGAVRAG